MSADLHTHSTASDGTCSPTEVMAAAAAAGLTCVALTDHDTTAGWDEAATALPSGLALVRGAEISARAAGISLHLLAYLFDRDEPTFAAERARLRDDRVLRAQRMVQKLAADGHPVTFDRVRELAGGGDGVIGRPHVAAALVEAGLVPDVASAFSPQWIGNSGPYHVGKYELDAVEAVRLIRGAGGVAVFAHPRATKRGPTVGDEVIEELAAAGLAGVEVDHPDQTEAQRADLRVLAERLGLLVTGSSDFHGSTKPQGLGAETTAADVLDQIEALATGCAVVR